MPYTTITPWAHDDLVSSAKMQIYADNLDYLMADRIHKRLYPSPPLFLSTESYAMFEHWNRWLYYISESEEETGTLRPHFNNVVPVEDHITLEYAPEGAYYDLDTIEWMYLGLIVQVNYVKTCFEVELFNVDLPF